MSWFDTVSLANLKYIALSPLVYSVSAFERLENCLSR